MSIDQLIKEEPLTWKESLSNKVGRMAQGIRDVKGNNVLVSISYHEVQLVKKSHMEIRFEILDHRSWKNIE